MTTRSPTIDGVRPAQRASWADPSYWLYTATLDVPDEARRDRLLAGLAAAGIEARPIWRPIHRTQTYQGASRLGGPVADRIFASAFCLPSSSSLTEAEQDRVIDALRAAVAAATP